LGIIQVEPNETDELKPEDENVKKFITLLDKYFPYKHFEKLFPINTCPFHNGTTHVDQMKNIGSWYLGYAKAMKTYGEWYVSYKQTNVEVEVFNGELTNDCLSREIRLLMSSIVGGLKHINHLPFPPKIPGCHDIVNENGNEDNGALV
jgi:hypothetical protein